MYQTQWGLEKSPFPGRVETSLFFEGASQREALARLRFLVSNDRRLGVVVGAAGSGKSLLLQTFAEQCLRQGRAIARLDVLGLTVRGFLWQLCAQLGAPVRVEDDLLRLWRTLSDRLRENRQLGIDTVLLLDDVPQAGPDLLAQIRRLARQDDGDATVIMTCNDGQLGRLGVELVDLVDLHIELFAWDELDTTGFLQLALVEAGCQQPPFDDGALSEIQRLSGGLPRQVQRLADYALLAGSGAGGEQIDAATIRAAHEAIKMPVKDSSP